MKNKKKFSIVDLAIIFAFVCIIGGIVFRTYNKNSLFGNSSKVVIEYTMEINGTDKELRKLINNGDSVFLADDGTYLGYIVDCNRTTSKVYEKGQDGNMITVNDISALDITLTVRAQALKTKSGYCINTDTYILPGFEGVFSTGRCEFVSEIADMKVLSNDNIG